MQMINSPDEESEKFIELPKLLLINYFEEENQWCSEKKTLAADDNKNRDNYRNN